MRHWMLSTTPDGDESGPYGMESFDGNVIPVPTEQDPDPYPICSMYYTSDETNAKLIASAPEIRDTLTAIAAALNCAPDDVRERVAAEHDVLVSIAARGLSIVGCVNRARNVLDGRDAADSLGHHDSYRREKEDEERWQVRASMARTALREVQQRKRDAPATTHEGVSE